MREAIFNAELGDDALGDDPTVKRLETMAAERLGKEAALFVASGTMGNLVALLTHCRRGDEAVAGDWSHMLNVEVAGAAAVAGVQIRAARNDERGRMDPDEIRGLIRPRGQYQPRTALVAIENTHNYCNGSALPASYTQEVADLAHAHGAAVHIDGARIFNAAIALETTAKELARPADSVQFCLSKGLACPIGSLICGSGDFIYEARRQRRMVGGGMRQVGILAAAGIVALEEMVERLADDHANARRLVDGLATIPGINVTPDLVQTNILFFEPDGVDGALLGQRLKERGILATGSVKRFRMVTHYGIETEDVDYAVDTIREVVASL